MAQAVMQSAGGCGCGGGLPIQVGWIQASGLVTWCRVVPGATVVATAPGGAVIDTQTTDSAGNCSLAIPAGSMSTVTITASKSGYNACGTSLNIAGYPTWGGFGTFWPCYASGTVAFPGNMLFLAPNHLTLGTSVGTIAADLWIDTSIEPYVLYWLGPKTLSGIGSVFGCDAAVDPECATSTPGTDTDVLVSWRYAISGINTAFTPPFSVPGSNFISTEPGLANNNQFCDLALHGVDTVTVGWRRTLTEQVGGSGPCYRWTIGTYPCTYDPFGSTTFVSSTGTVICGSSGLVATGTLSAGGLLTGTITATE
jgi:hypothetical protein